MLNYTWLNTFLLKKYYYTLFGVYFVEIKSNEYIISLEATKEEGNSISKKAAEVRRRVDAIEFTLPPTNTIADWA